jgi:uncharacterized protein (TIGR01777 family)
MQDVDIAITGSHGLIGTALVASLTADGHRVRRVVRSGAGPDDIGWDLDAGTIDRASLEGLDAVVHLGGEGIGDKRWNDEHKRKVIESRRVGTTLLAEALAGLSLKPRVLVSGSAVGYYGDRADEILTEASGAGDIFLSEVCVAWEAATAPAAAAGIRVAHIRTGIVLAPAGGALGPMLKLFRLGIGGRLGSGRQWWSWISLADEVGAIRFLLDADVAGPVNLTGPEPVTNATFTKALGTVLHRPTFLAVPAFAPRLAMGRDMADSLLFVSERAVPNVLEAAGYEFRHRDVHAALSATLAAS